MKPCMPLMLLACLCLALAACGAGGGQSVPLPAVPVDAPHLAAGGLAFDRSKISLPAGKSFALVFENREGVPHNVALYDGAGHPVFEGDVFGGPGMRVYQVPALAPGRYAFRCSVHPDMHGTALAG